MNDETRTLASEIISEIEDEKREIIRRLEYLEPDLDKALFVLESAQETLEYMKEPESLNDAFVQFANSKNALTNTSIVFDYLIKIQDDIRDVIDTHFKKLREQPKNNQANQRKRISEMLDQITDEEALNIIWDFVRVPYFRENGEKANGLQESEPPKPVQFVVKIKES